jgi:hypothetical protein
LFNVSRDRQIIHPNKHLACLQGVLQADAYSGCNDLYLANRAPGPVRSALCWSHARRKFFELADIAGAHHWARTNGAFTGALRKNKPAHDISPVAPEAVKRTWAIFDMRRETSMAWMRLRAMLQGRADAAHRSRGRTAGCPRSAPDCRNTTASQRPSTSRCLPKAIGGQPSPHSGVMGASA